MARRRNGGKISIKQKTRRGKNRVTINTVSLRNGRTGNRKRR